MTDLPPRLRIADEDVYVRVGDVLDHLNSRSGAVATIDCPNCDRPGEVDLGDVFDYADLLAALDAAILDSRRKGL